MNDLTVLVDNLLTHHHGLSLTVRRWAEKYCPPLPARMRLEDSEGRFANVSIVGEKQMRFYDIPEGALAFEHDESDTTKAGLLASMQKHYPGFMESDRVVLIWYWF